MSSYSENIELTPAGSAPMARQQAAPCESSAWAHQVAEAEQAISQMRGPEMGSHQVAVLGGPTSVADAVPPMKGY